MPTGVTEVGAKIEPVYEGPDKPGTLSSQLAPANIRAFQPAACPTITLPSTLARNAVLVALAPNELPGVQAKPQVKTSLPVKSMRRSARATHPPSASVIQG